MSNYSGKDPSPELFPLTNTPVAPGSHYLFIFATSLLRKSLVSKLSVKTTFGLCRITVKFVKLLPNQTFTENVYSKFVSDASTCNKPDRNAGAHKIRKKLMNEKHFWL